MIMPNTKAPKSIAYLHFNSILLAAETSLGDRMVHKYAGDNSTHIQNHPYLQEIESSVGWCDNNYLELNV
ncbi:hypothetical protein RRG08_039591 [Elysia crispata]|uniref:Uncharacterized protein n=1 Tax=Elysia crispata TaxID=231223 RepID=A0AAE1E127_9GAST|nr:hypothetical protein RRG08_039591 [Elysia crispata]